MPFLQHHRLMNPNGLAGFVEQMNVVGIGRQPNRLSLAHSRRLDMVPDDGIRVRAVAAEMDVDSAPEPFDELGFELYSGSIVAHPPMLGSHTKRNLLAIQFLARDRKRQALSIGKSERRLSRSALDHRTRHEIHLR